MASLSHPEHLHLCGCLHGQCPADSKLYHFDPFYIAQIQMIQSKRAEANNRVPLRPFPVLHIFSPLPQEILHNLRANGLHPGSNAMKRSLMKLVYLGLWTTYWRVLRQSKTCFLFFVIATCRFGHLSFFCHLGLPFFLRLFFFGHLGLSIFCHMHMLVNLSMFCFVESSDSDLLLFNVGVLFMRNVFSCALGMFAFVFFLLLAFFLLLVSLAFPVSRGYSFCVFWHWPLHLLNLLWCFSVALFSSVFSALVVALKVLWHLEIN